MADGTTFDISQAANGVSASNLSGAGDVVLGSRTLAVGPGTFSGAISGTGGLDVSGFGFTVSGVNNYTGATTINTGSLSLSGNGSIAGSSGVSVSTGEAFGIFNIARTTGGASIKSLSSGTLGSVQLGSKTLTLTQANGIFEGTMYSGDGLTLTGGGLSVTGGTEIFAGKGMYADGTTIGAGATLQIGNGGTRGSIEGDVLDNGTLTFNRGDAYTFAGAISGAGAVNQTGPGTPTLSGANNYTGGTTIGTGTTLQVGDGATSGSIGGDVLDNGTLIFDRGDAYTFAGVISGAGAVNQIGSGTLTLSGASGYTGGTTISSGKLALSGSGSISSSLGVSVAGGAAFDISGTTSGASIKTLSGAGDVTLGGQALTLTDANDTFSGAFSGTGGLTLTGGTETLTGTNNSIGKVTVGGGTLAFGQNGMFGATSYDTQSGATTTIGGTSQLAVSGAFTQDAGSTLNITVSSSNTPVITADTASLGGTLNIAGISSQSQLPQVLVSTANGIGGDFSSVSIGGFVGTVDYLTVHTGKSADDTEYLATYGLSWTANNSLAHGTFTLTNPSDSFNVGIALGDETANPVTGWDGKSLTKAGDGTLILSAANVYTGGTTITGGVLQLGNGVNAGSIFGNISTSDPGDSTKSGTLVFEEPDATTFGGVISGSGSVRQAGPGSLTLTAANSYLGGTTVDTGAALVVGNDSALGTGALALQEGSTLDTSGSHTLANAISLSGDPTVNVNSSLTLNLAGAISDGASPGVLEKTGDGTLILSADNSYSGGTTIRGGTLQLGNGGASGSIVGNVVDNGTLAFDRGDTYVFNGLISGSGAVNQIGTGTTALTEDNSYGGGTTISGGTLQLGNGGASGSIVGGVVDNGTLAFDRGDTYVFSGAISGSGAVKQTGTGTTVLTGTNSYDGGTALDGGTLQVSRDANLGDTAGALTFDGGILNTTGTFSTGRAATLNAGGGTFDVDPSTTLTMSGAIDGVSNLTKAGGGTLDLTADSSAFTGSTTIEAGLLSVNGSLANSDIAVDNGATLGGAGKVGAIEIGSGGTLSPGDSGIGTLTATGNVNFLNGSRYKIDIDASGQSDRLDVSGAVTIAGNSTVDVLSAPGGYALGNRYTILSANGGVSGDFAGLSFSSPLSMPFLSFGLEHDMLNDPDNIYLAVARSSVTFASVGQTPNQIGVGGALDGLSSSNPLVAALVQLDTPAAGAAFDQLSGEVHASTKSALIEDSHFVRDAIDNRIRSAFHGVGASSMPVLAYGETGTDSRATSAIGHALVPADTSNLAAWGSVFGSWGSFDGNGNAAELSRSVGGFFTGIDGLVAENVRLGIMTGYSHDSFHVDGRGSSGQSDNYHLGIYGGTQTGNLGLRAGVAYTWHDISTGRSVAFPGFADGLTADYHAGTFQAFGEAGYRIDTMVASFEPFANLAYVNLHTDGFTEKGGAAALHADGQTTDTTFTTLGVRASTAFDLGGMKATARGTVGWRHAYGDTTSLATLAFAGGAAFSVAGVPIAKDAAILEAGLDFAVSHNVTLGISYAGQFGSQARDNGAKASLDVSF